MHRFFVPPDCIREDTVVLPEDIALQLSRVLRSRPGDRIMVLDDTGWEYEAVLESVGPGQARGSIAARRAAAGEPRAKITLYQSLLKRDRFELALQKCTELGVSRFVPTVCARSVARTQSGEGRTSRMRKIITEAAEQSRRGRVPVLDVPMSFTAACDAIEGPAVIPWEGVKGTSLRSALGHWRADGIESGVSLLIGPEGGFTAEEIEHARSRGIEPVTLGPRILRAETAAIAAVSAILHEMGDMGGR